MEPISGVGDKGPRGKLIWAGRASVEGGLFERPDRKTELEKDAENWGFDLSKITEGDDEAHSAIWPENASAVEAYLNVQTQWRAVSVGRAGLLTQGLDYHGVEAGLRMAGIAVTPDLFTDLQLIEMGAKDAKNGVSR